MGLKRLTLASPPDPSASTTWQDYAKRLTAYLNQIKGQLEDTSRVNGQPALQGLVLGTYTQVTMIDNTLTGTDLANAVCSLTQALQNFGITTPSTRK